MTKTRQRRRRRRSRSCPGLGKQMQRERREPDQRPGEEGKREDERWPPSRWPTSAPATAAYQPAAFAARQRCAARSSCTKRTPSCSQKGNGCGRLSSSWMCDMEVHASRLSPLFLSRTFSFSPVRFVANLSDFADVVDAPRRCHDASSVPSAWCEGTVQYRSAEYKDNRHIAKTRGDVGR